MPVFPNQVTSANDLPGCEIVENLGIVRGIVVRSRSIVGSFWGGLQTIVGGDITAYTSLCERTRADAFDRMLDEARKLGATGVIGFRYEANEIMQGVTEVLAYGTAVRTQRKAG